MSALDATFDRLDRLVNLDVGRRGIEPLYAAARAATGAPLCGAMADALLGVPIGATVIATTGSVSRAWISGAIGENDGPSGAAAVIRALVLARRACVILLVEEALIPAMARVLQAAGLSVVDRAAARIAADDGSLATVVIEPFPLTDAEAHTAARALLDALSPALLFSTERVGRNINGIYYNMRGRDYGMARARIDILFDLALARGITTLCVGDGGNEIGMGNVADAVATSVPHGAPGACPCGGGIGAVSKASILMTAAVSNWGATAISAAMAAQTGDARLLHTPDAEARLLSVMAAEGLINSADGLIDENVDGLPKATHVAVAELARALVAKHLT
ncbi:MAG: glutamate cyclase domain-containing protein [Pseudomonadota bacterium]